VTTYTDFDFYEDTYLGNAIAEADFPRLALNASAVIDLLTFNRAAAIVTAGTETDTIEKIELATCAVADVLKKIEDSGGQVVQSESVGRASVTYAKPVSQDAQAFSAAKLYLWPTGLMYRGFTADER
jgi:hypothetical protein